MNSNNNILSALGISDEEVRVYNTLLESGPSTAGVLAKRIGLARPTLYDTLQRLHEKGIVSRSLRRGVRTFMAVHPNVISQLFQKRIDHLSSQYDNFLELLPILEQKIVGTLTRPRFQLYEGIEGVQNVLKDMLLYRDCETMAFWPIKSMVELLSEDFFRYHNKERIRRNLYTRAIWPQRESVDIRKNPFLGVGKEFRREIRQAPTEIHFTMGYWMYQNKIAFLSSRAECFGFIIESQEMAVMQRAQFEVLWKISTPITVEPIYTQGFLDEMHHKDM
ncbi:MAG: helix-turn-helix domain-containing protein [Hyphomicrobiales bacterium]|nr:helix-turn-helix domain-containing protein [Rickettsiales bacterium]MCP5361513.1 helix-turn-helix domain-containing protein [Hyphomicrobiales bacterium]